MTGEDDGTTIQTECHGFADRTPAPCLMVIFGASGDLTGRSLMPSLYELAMKGLLPERFAVLGFAQQDWSDDDFRKRMRSSVKEHCDCDLDTGRWDEFAQRLHYLHGDFTSEQDYHDLKRRIDEIRRDAELPDNVFFHLAAPPSFFGTIADKLAAVGLSHGESGWRRLVIEKPFGEDRASARELHKQLQAVFDEGQIYRIDHFLGKETVQNMLVFRFANPSFEPIWNHRFIDHVQITVAEELGIGTRGAFYEKTGVVRDMIQNHLLQLLCMTAIEPPVAYNPQSLRDETVKVLRAIQPPQPDGCVCGQYGPGLIEGKQVPGYRDEDKVAPDSTTATFAAMKLEVGTWRWSGVPFYLRTGKRLARKFTEVAVFFKPTPHLMFASEGGHPHYQNVLTFRLQPEEGILQRYIAKRPGSEICLTPVNSRFLYADAFGISSPPRAYGWLLLDVMEGDQTLFAREDWIDQAWSIIDPVVSRLADNSPEDFPNYAAGSWGPEAAAELLERDGRRWKSD
jgi:glucose-6-phosphate 1-dehydrogenase